MGLSDFFKRLFGKKEELEIEMPEGACPNCWGTYDYAGMIRKAVYDQQIDVNNGKKKKAFIAAAYEKYVDGAHLQLDPKGRKCARCEVAY